MAISYLEGNLLWTEAIAFELQLTHQIFEVRFQSPEDESHITYTQSLGQQVLCKYSAPSLGLFL